MAKLYRAYFFRGRDPVLNEIHDIMREKYGNKPQFSAIEKAGGPTGGTLRNWEKGKTRRPQNATVEAAGRALGMKRVWVKGSNNGEK